MKIKNDLIFLPYRSPVPWNWSWLSTVRSLPSPNSVPILMLLPNNFWIVVFVLPSFWSKANTCPWPLKNKLPSFSAVSVDSSTKLTPAKSQISKRSSWTTFLLPRGLFWTLYVIYYLRRLFVGFVFKCQVSIVYCISSFSFHPWIVSAHLCTVTFGFPNSKKYSFRRNYMRKYGMRNLLE